MKKEAVLDWGATMRIPYQTQSGQIGWKLLHGVVQAQHDDGADEKNQTLDTRFAPFFRIEEIAFLLGYSDLSNFRRAFKRWESVPPSEYLAQSARPRELRR